ncbi:MAG: hypothetical protein MJE63_20280 [Proteobacteria bacterium]|nr:hypothetical protein [Pseudomonadota bacterium]
MDTLPDCVSIQVGGSASLDPSVSIPAFFVHNFEKTIGRISQRIYCSLNRQPPTANRQPPTANRQPPTENALGMTIEEIKFGEGACTTYPIN